MHARPRNKLYRPKPSVYGPPVDNLSSKRRTVIKSTVSDYLEEFTDTWMQLDGKLSSDTYHGDLDSWVGMTMFYENKSSVNSHPSSNSVMPTKGRTCYVGYAGRNVCNDLKDKYGLKIIGASETNHFVPHFANFSS